MEIIRLHQGRPGTHRRRAPRSHQGEHPAALSGPPLRELAAPARLWQECHPEPRRRHRQDSVHVFDDYGDGEPPERDGPPVPGAHRPTAEPAAGAHRNGP
ncbi:hypothetical protein ADZ36_26370 [Streptomyces fradiae]|uniref:Uncharacterized protein n=2 Tax=Streptomyces TaxID=1883 RepID=A0A3M8FA99_9ACTN|nr:hypothetical protein ADZ36_26370 [Streptomyces fradiae]OFA37746.1 hypothetical protein BEN35_28765 [Streptomyces fradiae]PQM23216.1 hypothetical protein Sfr7A_11515 [Streptomyces xinghaiensis]RKM94777.1 hypothetical protein SFRA_015975 [Streptomyces xinghaiensis]RNC74782.1 hypothetical protein DC095_008975 [Streptomyces xinghaiensis]